MGLLRNVKRRQQREAKVDDGPWPLPEEARQRVQELAAELRELESAHQAAQRSLMGRLDEVARAYRREAGVPSGVNEITIDAAAMVYRRPTEAEMQQRNVPVPPAEEIAAGDDE